MDDLAGLRRVRVAAAFEYMTKHLAVLSVITTVVGATLAVIFIAAYLRVFDWQLIWIIEYPDILKVALVAIAAFSGFSWYIWSSAADAINLATEHSRGWLISYIFGFALWSGSLITYLYLDYHSTDPHYGLHFNLHLAILAVIMLIYTGLTESRKFPNQNAKQVAWLLFLIVSNVTTLGSAFGYYTKDVDGFSHNVYLKNEELHDVGVVMITSHHVVLFTKDKSIILVPAADVVKIESKTP